MPGTQIKNDLEPFFPTKLVRELLTIAFLRTIHCCPFKRIEQHYEHSHISNVFSNLSLGSSSITVFLQELGDRREDMVNFMKSRVSTNKHILFDGTNILTSSKKAPNSQKGKKSRNTKYNELNLLYAFNYEDNCPEYYRLLPGNIVDVTSFKNAIEESQITNAIIVADKGFSSNENLSLLEEASLKYVMPLKRNNKALDVERLKTNDKTTFDGQFIYNDRAIWFFKREYNNRFVHTYIDESLKTEEEKDYLTRINNNYNGYSMESFQKKQYTFGVILLITNINEDSKHIYETYKTRGVIEESFDHYNNLIGQDKSYMQSDVAMEAWAFINHISMQFVYSMSNKIKKANLTSKYSTKDLVEHLRYVKTLKINGEWKIGEITQKTYALLSKLGTPIV